MNEKDPGFLGVGWHFPPRFARGGAYVETCAAEQDVQESLQLLLATMPGERAMREDFGCDLNALVFEELSQELANRISRMVSDSILDYEARIDLHAVEVETLNSEAGVVLIRVDYTVRGTNSRFNLVYPFYLNESASGV